MQQIYDPGLHGFLIYFIRFEVCVKRHSFQQNLAHGGYHVRLHADLHAQSGRHCYCDVRQEVSLVDFIGGALRAVSGFCGVDSVTFLLLVLVGIKLFRR